MPWWNFWRKSAAPATVAVPSQSAPAPSQNGTYITIAGRRRIADIPYLLPNDLMEQHRLDFQHYILRYLLRSPFAAPLNAPKSILDVGSGTGRWAYEMATIFPDANVIGIDVAEQPLNSTLATQENYTFVKGNVLEGLPFADNTFDYVHMRFMAGALPTQNWLPVIQEMKRVTIPGGWIELTEGSLPRNGGPALTRIIGWGLEMSRRFGVDPEFGAHIGDFLYQAGLANIQMREAPGPIGPYGGHVGQMLQTNGMALMDGMRGPVVAQGIASEADYRSAFEQLATEFAAYRAEQPFYIAIGQKSQ